MMTSKSPPASEKELRHFGLLMGLFISVIFGVLFPWLAEHSFPVWPWAVGAAFGLIALVSARLLRPVFRVWMAFALVMNWVMTRLVLGIVFYLFVWPTPLAIPINKIQNRAPGGSSPSSSPMQMPSRHGKQGEEGAQRPRR